MAEIELPNPEEIEEHKKDAFSKRVALCTALFAVMLAITSLGGNNAAKDMMLSQQQSSNQWAFYQSKVMREHLYRVEQQKAAALLVERSASMNSASPGIIRKKPSVVRCRRKTVCRRKTGDRENSKKTREPA